MKCGLPWSILSVGETQRWRLWEKTAAVRTTSYLVMDAVHSQELGGVYSQPSFRALLRVREWSVCVECTPPLGNERKG